MVREYLCDPTYRIYCRQDNGLSLGIQDGEVKLVYKDYNDKYQKWYMYSGPDQNCDRDGHYHFALINKGTCDALAHGECQGDTVYMSVFDPPGLDTSLMWTESDDVGDGYKTIRMCTNVELNLDAARDENGDIFSGCNLVLYEYNNGHNQMWKFECWD